MLDKIFDKLAVLSIQYIIAFNNFLLRITMEDMYVICKRTKEFFSLDSVEVEEYIDKKHGIAAKFLCPLCNVYHTSMIMDKP